MTKRNLIPGSIDGVRPETVRLSPAGEQTAGNASEEFAAAVAYAARMGDIIGELLGLDAFTAIEFSLSNGACVVARTASGDLCAAKAGPSYDISVLRDAAHVA